VWRDRQDAALRSANDEMSSDLNADIVVSAFSAALRTAVNQLIARVNTFGSDF
jgi:hypothetical protein